MILNQEPSQNLPLAEEHFMSRGWLPPRRKRRLVAIAEPLESRTLLSAVGIEQPSLILAEVENTEIETSDAELNGEKSDVPEFILNSDEVTEVFPAFGGGGAELSPDYFQSAISSPSVGRANASTGSGFSDSTEFSPVSTDNVEVRLADTGELVSVGAGFAVQSDDGVLVQSGDGPTAFLKTTDAEGRVILRRVNVIRTSRSDTSVAKHAILPANNVIAAEATDSEQAFAAEWGASSELPDLMTALDSVVADTDPTNAPIDGEQKTSSLVLELASISFGTPIENMTTRGLDGHNADHAISDRPLNHNPLPIGSVTDRDADDQDLIPLQAEPAFEPQPRHLVLALCLIGSLTKPFARAKRWVISFRKKRQPNLEPVEVK